MSGNPEHLNKNLQRGDSNSFQFQPGQMVIHPLKTVVKRGLFRLSLEVEKRIS